MQITEYWRSNKLWSKYLGKKGKVLAVSLMEVAATDQVDLLPFSYLVVQIGSEKLSLMGAAHQEFQVGDRVEIVLRKIKKEAQADIVVYGLKAEKI